MNSPTLRAAFALLLAQMLALPVMAASTYRVRANTVIPIIIEDDLSARHNRPGDRFSARVDDDRDLPRGTRLEGVVTNVRPAERGRPAALDASFEGAVLPDGRRYPIAAIPITLSSKAIGRDRDGRLVADGRKVRSENYVLGGLVGGLLMGSILHKPFEGAFIGTIAGILIGESERSAAKNEYVVRRGSRIGALFQRDFAFEGPDSRDDDRRDNRGNDRYSDRDRGGYDRQIPDRIDPRDRDQRRAEGSRTESVDRDERATNDRYDRYDRDADATGTEPVEPAPAPNQPIDLRVDNRKVTFAENERPFMQDGVWMVSIESAALAFGLTSEASSSGRAIIVEGDETMLKLEQGSDTYRLNGKRERIAQPVMEKNGVLYAPLEVIASVATKSVTLNGRKLAKSAY